MKTMNKTFFLACSFLILLKGYCSEKPVNHVQKGREAFNTHCSKCHAFGKEIVGPSLASVNQKRDRKWLKDFIRNSQKLIAAGDSQAVILYRNFNFNVMPTFYQLTEIEIDEILLYIDKESKVPVPLFQDEKHTVTKSDNSVPVYGKTLFENQCGHCHAFGKQLVGPALGSVVKTRSREWLVDFIGNPAKMIKAGNPYANFLYSHYSSIIMPDFDYLTDEQLSSILTYLKTESESESFVEGVNGRATNDQFHLAAGSQKNQSPYGWERKSNKNSLGVFKITFGGGTSLLMIFLLGIIVFFYKILKRKDASGNAN